MSKAKSDEGVAITAIGRALDKVDDAAARDRVLEWALKKYGTAAKAAPQALSEQHHYRARSEPVSVDGNTKAGDLFELADPQSDGDRILVVGYWLETAKATTDFDSQTVNSELKALGYGLTDVNKKFDSVVARRPQLIRQTSKSGKSKQARKKFKLTAEGRKRVEALLRGEKPATEAAEKQE
jgi:hypothetical protein